MKTAFSCTLNAIIRGSICSGIDQAPPIVLLLNLSQGNLFSWLFPPCFFLSFPPPFFFSISSVLFFVVQLKICFQPFLQSEGVEASPREGVGGGYSSSPLDAWVLEKVFTDHDAGMVKNNHLYVLKVPVINTVFSSHWEHREQSPKFSFTTHCT